MFALIKLLDVGIMGIPIGITDLDLPYERRALFIDQSASINIIDLNVYYNT